MQLKKQKVALGLVDEFTYTDANGLQEEVSNLNYFTQTDLDRDLDILDKILESANELGLDVTQIYPDYNNHRELVDQGIEDLAKFEEQKQEFLNESKSV